MDDETRKALHEIRDTVHLMQLETAKTNGEVRAEMVELGSALKAIYSKLQQMVTQTEFAPVKAICYGMTGMVLTAAMGAILAIIFVR